MTLKTDTKFEQTLNFWLQKWHEELMHAFCPKHMFQLENFRGIMYHNIGGWFKIQRKVDLWLYERHKQFG